MIHKVVLPLLEILASKAVLIASKAASIYITFSSNLFTPVENDLKLAIQD